MDIELINALARRPGFQIGLALLLAALVLRRVQPRLRRASQKWLFGDLDAEYPELLLLLKPILLRTWGIVRCETLFNYVLVRHPSKTTRALLKAYGARMQRTTFAFEEHLVDNLTITEEALRIALQTCFAVRSSRPGMKTIDHSELLVAMFGQAELADALRQVGLSKLKVTYFLSHGIPLPAGEERDVASAGEPVCIEMRNDHYSSMDLVTQILSEVFGFDADSSTVIMHRVHRQGRALLGPYPGAVATDRFRRAIAMARAAEAPLLLSLTTEAPAPDAVGGAAAAHDASHAPRNPYAPPASSIKP